MFDKFCVIEETVSHSPLHVHKMVSGATSMTERDTTVETFVFEDKGEEEDAEVMKVKPTSSVFEVSSTLSSTPAGWKERCYSIYSWGWDCTIRCSRLVSTREWKGMGGCGEQVQPWLCSKVWVMFEVCAWIMGTLLRVSLGQSKWWRRKDCNSKEGSFHHEENWWEIWNNENSSFSSSPLFQCKLQRHCHLWSSDQLERIEWSQLCKQRWPHLSLILAYQWHIKQWCHPIRKNRGLSLCRFHSSNQ